MSGMFNDEFDVACHGVALRVDRYHVHTSDDIMDVAEVVSLNEYDGYEYDTVPHSLTFDA